MAFDTDTPLSDNNSLVEDSNTPQLASAQPITMTPVTSTRTHWARFYAELDAAQCRGNLEKAVFRYCADRPDVPIPFAEIIMALDGTHAGLDVTKIQNIAGKLARKFQDGKSGFSAYYHVDHQTLMYVTVENKSRVVDSTRGSAEIDAILRTSRFRAAPLSHLDRDPRVQGLVELLGESAQQVRRMIQSGELDWLLQDEPGSDPSKK